MNASNVSRPLFIPVLLGTGREDRRSEPVANFVFGEVLPVLRELGLTTIFTDVNFALRISSSMSRESCWMMPMCGGWPRFCLDNRAESEPRILGQYAQPAAGRRRNAAIFFQKICFHRHCLLL